MTEAPIDQDAVKALRDALDAIDPEGERLT